MKSNNSLRTHLVSDRAQKGFTRLDLFMVIATCVLLAGLVLPLMANTKPRAEQAACANNLRQIGQAIRSWGAEHGNQNPWRVRTDAGGTSYINHPGSAWVEFYFIRNELVTPKILACPSDTKRPAESFPQYMAAGYRDDSTSYFIGLDTFFDTPWALLSGDRNIANSGGPVACSSGVNNAMRLNQTDTRSLWTNAVGGAQLHYPNGNILFNNGVVEQLPNISISNALHRVPMSDVNIVHILYPY